MTVITGQLLSGTGAPQAEDGADGDHYRDLSANVLYYKDQGEWTAVTDFNPQLDTTGTIWLTGEGAPEVSDGEDGNYYRDSLTQVVYFKADGEWTAIGDLDGPTNPVDEQKLWGVNGTPEPELGADGDFAIDRNARLFYEKVEGEWVLLAQLGTASAQGTFGLGNGAPAPEFGSPGMFYLDLQTLDVWFNGEGWAVIAQWAGSTENGFSVGEWEMGGEPAPLVISAGYSVTLGGEAPNVTITPDAELIEATTEHFVALGKSPIGVDIDGTGVRSAKLVFPAWTGSDNLNGVGLLLVNASAADEDITKIVVGGTGADSVYGGGYAFFGPDNQAQAMVINGTSAAFGDLTTLGQDAGDAIYLTYDAETDKLTIALNDGDEVGEIQLDFDGMVDTSLKLVAFMSFADAAPVFAADSIIVVAGTDDNGRLPLTAQQEATVPEDAADGKIYKVTQPGIFGNKETKLNDYVQLYANKTEILIIRVSTSVEPTPPGAGTPEFLGDIDLTPQYTPEDATGDILTNATATSGAQGVQTISPIEPLTTLPGLGAPYNGFAATASNITPPATGNANASLVWPDLSLDSLAAAVLIIHDENVTAGAAMKRMLDGGTGASMYAMMYNAAMMGGAPAGSSSMRVSGTAAPSSPLTIDPPTTGAELIFGLDSEGNTYLRTADNSYNETLAAFPIADMPDGTKLKVSVLFFTTETTTNIPNLVVDFATQLDDVTPFSVETLASITLPTGAKDGDFLHCTGAGIFGTKEVAVDEHIILTLDTTDCIVIPVGMTTAMVQDLIAAALEEGGDIYDFVTAAIADAIAGVTQGLKVIGDWDMNMARGRGLFVAAHGVLSGDPETGSTLTGNDPLVYSNFFGGFATWVEDSFDENGYVDGQVLEVVVPSVGTNDKFTVGVQIATSDIESAPVVFAFQYAGPSGGTIAFNAGGTVGNDASNQNGETWRIKINLDSNYAYLFSSSDGFSGPLLAIPVNWTAGDLPPVGVSVRTVVGLGKDGIHDSAVVTGLINGRFGLAAPEGAAAGQTYRMTGSFDEFNRYGRKALQELDFASFYATTKQIVIIREGEYVDERLLKTEISGIDLTGLSEIRLASTMGSDTHLLVSSQYALPDGSTLPSLDVYVMDADQKANKAIFDDNQLLSLVIDCSDAGSGPAEITSLNIRNFNGGSSGYPALSIPSGGKMVLTLGVSKLSNGGHTVLLISALMF